MSDADPAIVNGRSCAGCALCCKVMGIAELGKPEGSWCPNCNPAVGCKIYADRPEECARFYCRYLTQQDLGEEWAPRVSKIVLAVTTNGLRLAAHVDPQRPDAWRKEPYYSQLKRWAEKALPRRGQVVVRIARRAIVLFPDKEVDLGIVGDEEHIVTSEHNISGRTEYQAHKIHKDDPRIRNAANFAGQTLGRAAKNITGLVLALLTLDTELGELLDFASACGM